MGLDSQNNPVQRIVLYSASPLSILSTSHRYTDRDGTENGQIPPETKVPAAAEWPLGSWPCLEMPTRMPPTRHHLASEHFSVPGTAGEQGLLKTRPRAEKPAAIKILSWRRAPIQVPYQRTEATSVLKKEVAPGSTAGQSQSPLHIINLPMLKAQLAGNSAATNAQADRIYGLQSQGYACAHSTSEPFSPKKSGSAKKGLELSGRNKQKYQDQR